MKKSLLLACFIFIISISYSQSITLLWKGGGTTPDWNNTSNWIQVNTPVGQAPIQRVPTEIDHVIFSKSQSGLANVFVKFPEWDSLSVGGNGTAGSRCRSIRVSETNLRMTDQAGDYHFRINVHTSSGGKVLIDSASYVEWGHFFLHGGNPVIYDLEILNSSFGDLFSHNNWSNVYILPNGKARFINSALEGYHFGAINFGTMTNGGELFAQNSTFATTSFAFGQNANVTLLNTQIFNDQNNPALNFYIGKNATLNTSGVDITSWAVLRFYTSGSTLKGNVTQQQENGGGPFNGFIFRQEDPSNPLPNIIDGNLTFQGGQGTLGIMGDVKISGNLVNNAFDEQLIYPDTSHVFVNGQYIFKIGGITNFRNNVIIDNCMQNLCRFKFEFFGNGNSVIKWPVGIPLDTMIINKSGCGKVLIDNSLYVSGQLHVQSGQLVLNPNDGIPYKLVSPGNVTVNSGAGIFLRRNAAGVPANMAIGGTLINNNTSSDSTCFGISNPYNGTILSYNPNVNNITVPVCINGGTSIVSNVSGNTYRWERNTGNGYTLITNGPNYSGATTATLQLLNIPASWDNYQFRCIVNGTIPSHTFVLDVVSSMPATVTITSTSTTFCPYNPITFYAHPVNAGPTPSYQWQVNGVNSGTNFSSFTPSTLANNDQVKVIVLSSLTCATPQSSASNVINVTVPSVVPAVTISSSATSVCSGSPVTFTALPVNGGPTPMYQWKVNGVPFFSGSVFTIASVTTTSVVTVTMTSAHVCAIPLNATSNEITVTVNPGNIIPSVSIIASAQNICNNATVTFTATPVNGGPTPTFQWMKNGMNVGTNSAVFTTATLLNADVISVSMISNASCVSPASVTSNTVTMSVNVSVNPSIIISGILLVDQGGSTTISSVITNGGNSPSYQWQDSTASHPWQNIANGVSPVLNYSPQSTGDKIRALLTSSAACANPVVVMSNELGFTVARPLPTDRVATYPNPASSYVILDSLSLIDQWTKVTVMSLGGKVYFSQNITGFNRINIPVQSLLPGMYMLRLYRNVGHPLYKKFIKL